MPDPPGVPSRHRREPDLAAERDSKRRAAPSPFPDHQPAPVIRHQPSLRAQLAELQIKRWQVISVALAAVVPLFTACVGGAVSVIQALQPSATAQLEKIDERLQAIQESADKDRKKATARKKQVEFLAEFTCRLNGGPPTVDYPCPREGSWTQPPAAQPIVTQGHKTSRSWAQDPE